MSRNVMFLIVAAVIGLLVFAGVSKFFDVRKIQDLQEREAVQQFAASESDKRQAVLMAQIVADSIAYADTIGTLRSDLRTAQTRTVRIVEVRDSARATIQEDTLSAGLRNLLELERGVATSFRVERDLERELRERAEVQIAKLVDRQRALRILLLDVTAQRDSALVLVGDAIAAASPSFFAKLFQDIPRKLACAGAGVTVASINDGDLLVGAGIGLAACLLVEAIL